MKKLICAIIVASLLLVGCGQPLEYKGKTYPTYGFINQDNVKSDKMCYDISIGNIVWTVLLVETVVAPIYFLGFSLYNPVGPKSESGKCGIDN